MTYILLSIFWLVIALFFGFTISYSGRIKKLPQIGLGFILGSFFIGLLIMVYAITEVL